MRGIDLAVGATRSGHGDEAQLCLPQCLLDVDGGAEAPGLPSLRNFIGETVLHDRRTAFVDNAYFVGIDVNAPDAVSRVGQASGRYRAYVALDRRC